MNKLLVEMEQRPVLVTGGGHMATPEETGGAAAATASRAESLQGLQQLKCVTGGGGGRGGLLQELQGVKLRAVRAGRNRTHRC